MRISEWIRGQGRKLYRQLRHPRHRKNSRWRAWLADRVLCRDLWQPNEHSMAWGMAVGLFLGMQPIPVQTPLAVLAAIKWRLNMPTILMAVGITNPLTWAFTFLPAGLIGGKILHGLGLIPEAIHLDMQVLEHLKHNFWNESGSLLASLVLGCLLCGVVLALVSYWLVRGFYRILPQAAPLRHRPKPLPAGQA